LFGQECAARHPRCLNGRGLKRLIYSGQWQVIARYPLKEMSVSPYLDPEFREMLQGIEKIRKLLL